MAVVTPALLDQNLTKTTTVVRSVSSFQAALPGRFLDDQARGKVWRSVIGWNIVAGINDAFTFLITPSPTEHSGTVPAGNYPTGVEMAAALAAALESTFALGWGCTYDGSTKKFTITSGGTDVSLKVGLHLAEVWSSVGFTTDRIGGTSFVSDGETTHSVEWVAYDFGSATAVTAAIALEHNLSSGTIKAQFSATSIVAALTNPTETVTLTSDSVLAYSIFASKSYRYVAFLIEDVANADAFSELAITYMGTVRSPKAYSGSFSRKRGSLSMGMQATEGALSGDQRPQERAWGLIWKNLEAADVALFEAFYLATPEYKCFFLHLDTAAGTSSLVYGYRDQSAQAALDTETAGLVYSTSFVFREALP